MKAWFKVRNNKFMNSGEEIPGLLREMFREAYVENCRIDESVVTAEDEKEIEKFSVMEVVKNFKELVRGLLEFKEICVGTELVEVAKRCEMFEKMLQKSEAEVRSHIRTENQLKLHIESIQSQSEDIEKQNSKYVKDIKKLQDKLKSLQHLKNDVVLLDRIQHLEDSLKSKDNQIQKLENENNSLKETVFRCDNDRPLIAKVKEKPLDLTKNKIVEGLGLNKIKKFAVEKPMRQLRDRSIRKSAFDGDVSRSILNERNKLEKFHFRSTSESIRPKSVGRRLPSR